MNRIAARITEKVINSAQEFTEITEELPQKLQNEWSRFKEEVIEESERLEKKTRTSREKSEDSEPGKDNSVQKKINNLRSKVVELNTDIERIN